MTPVTFGDCFGWIHDGKGRTGVVLCGSFGQEGMIAYHGWRDLAERLARSDLHVLRFDYPGVGDSLGMETDPDRLDAWLASIRAAATFLRANSGADRIVLIGLRLGGALALLASAAIAHVVAVACVVPVVSGRTYVRELRLMTNAWRDANLLPVAPALDGCTEVVGDRLTDATLRDLGGLDLRTVTAAPSHVLLMDDDAYPSTAELGTHLVGLGCNVSRSTFTGAAAYLQDPLTNQVPDESFDRLVQWCGQFRSVPAERPDLGRIPPSRPPPALMPGGEEPFLFGRSGELFGILSKPRHTRPNAPTIVMVNTGFGRRVGDGRVFVTLARRLAAIGVPSLRMDMAGFGDSRPGQERTPNPYSASHVGDLMAASDALARRGLASPTLVGICSGAYAVFHAAVADPRVHGAVIVNLQKFEWNVGASLKVENRRTRRPVGFYIRAVGERKAWRRLLEGRVEVVPILTSLLRRPWSAAYRGMCLRIEAATGLRTRAGKTIRDFRALEARGGRVDLVYSAGDPGLSELAQHFGHNARRLRGMRNVRLNILDAADHALLDQNARSQFIDMVIDRLQDDDHACDAPTSLRSAPHRPEPASLVT